MGYHMALRDEVDILRGEFIEQKVIVLLRKRNYELCLFRESLASIVDISKATKIDKKSTYLNSYLWIWIKMDQLKLKT